MTTVFTVVGVTKLIYEVLERDYGVPRPDGSGGTVTLPGGGTGGLTQAQIQTLIDTAIAGIPQSAGVTLDQVNAAIAAAVAGLPAEAGLDEPAVLQLLEDKLTDFAPMIHEAVQSQFKAMPKSIRLNTEDGRVSIEGLDISGPNKSVSLDMELPDGSLSVNGKRVLTVDDALDPSGVDTAAVEAALAPLQDQIAGLENQVRILTQYIDQEVGTVIQYADLALEKKAEKSALDDLSDKYEVDLGNTRQAINDVIEFVLNNYLTKRAYQELMDAMNGPNATTDSIQQMFWLLNDVVMALIEATGIEIDGKVTP